MKKVKLLTAFVLSITLLAGAAACKNGENEEVVLPPSSSVEENLPPSDSLDEPTPPAVETPPPTVAPPVSTPPVQTKAEYIKSTANSVNIRSGAGTGFAVLGSAEKGTMYAIIGQTGNWYKTYYRNQVAYISTSYASVLSLEKTQNEKVEDVISEGYKLIGVPYVYGAVRLHDGKGKLLSGFTAQKFDCSSLMQYIFYMGAGTLLDVTTRTQIKQGKAVKSGDLQRGDLMFFTNEQRQYKTGIERVGHVALYLGDNYILHTASDYARIEQISAQRWKFFIEARRFL
ncbi:MAG: C40 family peptidase [Clostridia bacterium]|nr:C40 family peptidase [Clostridia bacterium]